MNKVAFLKFVQKVIIYGNSNLIKFYLKNKNLSYLRETRPEGLEPSTSNFGD